MITNFSKKLLKSIILISFMLSSFLGLLSQGSPIDPKFQVWVSAGFPEDLIKRIITQGELSEQLSVIELRYVDADVLVERFQGLLHENPNIFRAKVNIIKRACYYIKEKSSKAWAHVFGGTYSSSETKIFAIPKQNKLVICGNKEVVDKFVDFIIKWVDLSTIDPATASKRNGKIYVQE